MRNSLLVLVMAFAAVLAASCSQQTGTQTASNKPFDAHDLTGYWDITDMGRPPGALNTTSNNRPPMTDWAKTMFSKTRTGYGELSSGINADPKTWNDPVLWCDPVGFPRVMWNPAAPGVRFVQAPNEVILFFETGRVWRDIWTDGRKLPAEGSEPRWYGYSVGNWEGDTFVVNSNNYVDTTWLDQYGSPHSNQMTVQERYRRTDQNHLELDLEVTDSTAYTAPWKGDKRIFVLVDKPSRSAFNDLSENVCVWSEARIRPRVELSR